MAAQRSRAAPNARAARISGATFAIGGAIAVLCGVTSILTGTPNAAHDLAPLAGPADLIARLGQTAPIVSAVLGAVVVVVVAAMMVRGRLASPAASFELLILGLAIDVCIGGAAGRIGHATDGSVLGSTVVCLMGGTAVVAGGIIAVLGRE
jgi:hypothetical protein